MSPFHGPRASEERIETAGVYLRRDDNKRGVEQQQNSDTFTGVFQSNVTILSRVKVLKILSVFRSSFVLDKLVGYKRLHPKNWRINYSSVIPVTTCPPCLLLLFTALRGRDVTGVTGQVFACCHGDESCRAGERN